MELIWPARAATLSRGIPVAGCRRRLTNADRGPVSQPKNYLLPSFGSVGTEAEDGQKMSPTPGMRETAYATHRALPTVGLLCLQVRVLTYAGAVEGAMDERAARQMPDPHVS
jgi:hypothetical protein